MTDVKFPGSKTHHEPAHDESVRSNTVVVGIDGSPASDDAVRWAAATAADRGLPLHIVHALDFAPSGYSGAPFIQTAQVFEWIEDEGKTLLQRAEEVARTVAPALEITTRLAATGSARWLIDLSAHARMLVLGSSGTGRVGEALLGSTPVAVASHGRCPVVVVRGEAPESLPDTRPVVVGVDGSTLSEKAVRAAFEEAGLRGVDLVAVHVWSDMRRGTFDEAVKVSIDPDAFAESEQALLAERLAGFHDRYPDVNVRREVYVDGPRAHLLAWSEKAQLLVVGSRGRGGFTGMLLGSTSNSLIRDAHCPVMVVRPDES
ncbi:Usp family protein [Rhodococcus ruber BKS 20-38]|uniref:Usp family protein n=1 Tax=Rhodococcus ruber BKS 20-38 TaxID=1278076 RepID=M2YJ11_9NOCA|nr:universal stress protein [Rhodococcus ruber]EME61780.1 Usp family protein [Rhodococcus ruber BKS 20-38]